MTTSRTSAQRSVIPPASRSPRPGLALGLLRAGLLVALALTFGRSQLLGVAAELRAAAPTAIPATAAGILDHPDLLAALAIEAAAAPPVAGWLRLLSALGLAAVGAELLLAAALIPLQRRTTARLGAAGEYLSVRSPAAPGALIREPSAPDLFRAVAGALPTGGRLSGRAPWYAFTIGAGREQPAELGVHIPAGAAQAHAQAAISSAIVGIAPDALVESRPDPLRAAAAPGRTIVWRELALALPPEYPLRLWDDSAGADLLGPLAAAIRPREAAYVELQLIVRPVAGAQGWALSRGWRGRATALRLALEARQDYALAPDVQALDVKLGAAAFEVTARVVAVAESPAELPAAHAAIERVVAAIAAHQARTASRVQRLVPTGGGRITLGADGGAPSALARSPRYAPPPAGLLPIRPWREPDVLTPPELAGLWRAPGAALAGLVQSLGCRRLPAPPHAFCEPSAEPRVVLGHARRGDGSHAPVGPTLHDLRQILHLTAGMGAGKSRLLANLCAQLVPHGFTLIDGKGDDQGGSLVAAVRQLIPLADEGRLAIVDVLDAEWPVGVNPLGRADLSRPGGVDLALGQVLALFARLDPETWAQAVGMQQFATMATLLVLRGEDRPTIAHIKQALLDEGYRDRLLERSDDPEVRAFWRVTFPQLGDGQRSSRDALLRRIDMLLTAETTRLLVSQADPPLDLLEAIERGLIVLVPVPDMTLGGLAGPVATLIFQSFVAAAFRRGGSDASRASYPLVVDELQVLLGQAESKDVETAITRLRSLGIPAVYAHQALGQLGDLQDLMMINAGGRVVLQTGEPDAGAYARAFGASGLLAADISGQDPQEHQYAAIRIQNRPTGVFSMRPLPWPAPLTADAPPYDGPDWRAQLPAPADPIDTPLLRIAYGSVSNSRAVAELAALSAPEWERVIARWDAIREFQRGYIQRNPGCIPDRLERQRWLSRLLIARPRLLAAAEHARARSGGEQPVMRR